MHGNLPAANDANPPRRPKPSSSCEYCHRRKVRCDINTFGSPCTSCRLDSRQCEKRVPLKRGRKSRSERDARQNAASAPSHGLSNGISGHNEVPSTSSGGVFEHPSTSPTDVFEPMLQARDTPQAEIPFDDHVPFYYHSYLERADIGHLSPIQISLLERQGCLKVPSGSALQEFLRHYFLYVHPCLPIINEASFWSIYAGQTVDEFPKTGISLALFQAMLFAASRFVAPLVIEACGFETLKHARTLFHRRAELLLINEVEKNTLARAQTSLLLSLQSTIEDQTLNSAWLTRAIEYARLANAHTYYRDALQTKPYLEKKKLWWCCILRDRMITIGVRRNIQVTHEDFDFDQAGLEEVDFVDEKNNSQVYSPETKAILAQIIAAQCELAVSQTPTMMAAYQFEHNDQSESPIFAKLLTALTGIERARTELAVWSRRYRNTLTSYADSARNSMDSSASIALFADMTLIHYFSTLVAISNHEVSVVERHQVHLDDYPTRLNDLNTHLRSSVANVADRVKRLSDEGLAHHLPISAPACTALPFVLEALNLRLSTSSQRFVHQKQLDYYNNIMNTFRAQHDHTECVTTAVDSILRVVEPEIGRLLLLTSADSPQSADSYHSPGSITTLSRPSKWSDILTNNPLIYLRLSLFLDLALSRGKAPHVTDLPIWTLGAADALQAPALASSLHLMTPCMPQNVLLCNDNRRFVELGDDGEAVMPEQWSNIDQTTSLEIQDLWGFADIEMISAWFNSV